MPCRTCLGTLDPDSSVHLTTVLPIEKSIEEILLFFIPKMGELKSDARLICSKCVDTLHVFTNFISKAIASEKYLTKEFLKQKQNKNVSEDESNTETLKLITLSPLPQIPTENEILSDQLETPDPILDVNGETIECQSRKPLNNDVETEENVVNKETNGCQSVTVLKNVTAKEPEIDVAVPEEVHQYDVIHINSLNSESGIPAILPLSNYLEDSKTNYSQVMSITKQKEDIPDILNRLSRTDIDLLEVDMSQKSKCRRIIFLSSNVGKNERIFVKKCPLCGKYFKSGKSLENHLVTHKNYNAFKCGLCGTTFKRIVAYNTHLNNYNIFQDCSIRICGICKKMMKENLFESHMDIHKTKECDSCDRKFITSRGLAKHCLEHEMKKKKEELCSICGKRKYSSKLIKSGGLLAHMRTHSEWHPYLCDKCPKAFRLAASLKKHNNIIHNCIFVECSICKKKLTKYGLQPHMRLKHSDQPPSHKCPICGKLFMRPDYYRKHIVRHSVLRAGKMARYRVSGNMNPTPDEEKTFACKYCERKYYNIHRLRIHLLSSHLKMARRPKCEICNMTFKDKANLARHAKTHEDNDYKSKCKVCWKKFDTEEELEEHLLVHKNSRRHKCGECGEFFPSRYLFYHHKNEKHFDEEVLNQQREALLEEGLSEFIVPD